MNLQREQDGKPKLGMDLNKGAGGRYIYLCYC